MASTSIIRPIGQTICLSVTASSHTAVTLPFGSNDVCNFASCVNTGSAAVAIKFSVSGAVAVLPSDGTPGDFLLPASMDEPINLSIPAGAVQVTAIGAASGPSLVYVTAIGDQS